MGDRKGISRAAYLCILLILGVPGSLYSQEERHLIFPEQRQLEIREPSQMPKAPLGDLPSPPTVFDPQPELQPLNLSLDEAIRTALANAQVIRMLAGLTATSTGKTIYDPAITNTQIDQARGRFDPSLEVNNNFFRKHDPGGALVKDDETRAVITGVPTNQYQLDVGLSKDVVTGGTAGLSVKASPTRSKTDALPLNPETSSSVDLSFTQPLLQGAGAQVNLAPIVIARIETERSFFQTKDSVQELVRGVIEAYWALVAARTEVWARQQQVDQGQWVLNRAKAQFDAGIKDVGDVLQAQTSLTSFQASLITAKANVLQREAALRNIMGVPPSDSSQWIPVTEPSKDRLQTQWPDLVSLAQERRPDLIELKLILEADQQRLLMARNQALPRADAVALYRWNGLEGWMPDGTPIASAPGQFTGWQLGVNFSVPLGLRKTRAALREQELLIMHDRANLEQGLHSAAHTLAENVRNLAQYYQQYEAFLNVRTVAEANLKYQLTQYLTGRQDPKGETIFLNVLQAMVARANAVSQLAQALTQYNTELANLERQTGTILETHGIRFAEERFCSIGPLGRLFSDRQYPMGSPPGPNEDRYPSGAQPAENTFDLRNPVPQRRRSPAAQPASPPQKAEPIPTPPPQAEEIPPVVPEPAAR